jgi:hypothetical protein
VSREALINLAGYIWILIFAASFLASLIVGGVQMYRRKEIWDTPALTLLMILHFAWVLPFAIPILAVFLAISALGWLIKRLTR